MESTLKEIIELATERGIRIITAESLTCGQVSASLANISGASAVVNGGFSVYQDEMKATQLGVPTDLLATFTAVSAQVAEAMAIGALEKTNSAVLGNKASNIAIAVTGYASSPGDLAPESDTGLVYIALATAFDQAAAPSVTVYEHRFEGDRSAVRAQTTEQALGYILDAIKEYGCEPGA